MSTTITKKNIVPYEIFEKYTKKMFKPFQDEELTKNILIDKVNYLDNGMVVSSDSFRAYKANIGHNNITGVYLIETNEKIDCKYPDIISVFANVNNNKETVKITENVDKMLKMLKVFKASNYYNTEGRKMESGKITTVSIEEKEYYNYEYDLNADPFVKSVANINNIEITKDNNINKVCLNTDYLIEVFSFVKDCKIKEIDIYFFDNNYPIIFNNKDFDLEIMLMPIKLD